MKENELKGRLTRYRQIKISVIGRKSGQTISIPVWFVLEGKKLYLLPVQGSDTQWYRNVLQNPTIRIEARGTGDTGLWPHNRQRQESLNGFGVVGFVVELDFPSMVGKPNVRQQEFAEYRLPPLPVPSVSEAFIKDRAVQDVYALVPLEERRLLVDQRLHHDVNVD